MHDVDPSITSTGVFNGAQAIEKFTADDRYISSFSFIDLNITLMNGQHRRC